MYFYCTHKEVTKQSIQCLKNVGNPIVQINASHTGRGHVATSNQSGELEKRTYLCMGASYVVLLTSNVWQIAGWGDWHSHGCHLLPVFLLLGVSLSMLESHYTGPHFSSENSGYGEGCVPIYPKIEYWDTVDGNKKTTHS